MLLAWGYMYTGMFIQAVSLHIPCRQLYLRLQHLLEHLFNGAAIQICVGSILSIGPLIFKYAARVALYIGMS